MSVTGGNRINRIIRNAGKGGVRMVRAGFFATAKYPDGTPVTAVAAQNEFGKRANPRIPERPFMRQAARTMRPAIKDVLTRHVNSKRMVVDERVGGLVGETMKAAIQTRIIDLKSPPNAPYTIEKKRSTNPLVDTGLMLRSVTYDLQK